MGGGQVSEYQDLIYEVKDSVAVITLDQPDKLNALSAAMIAGLARAVTTASEDDSVRAVILTGAGRGFCSGRDLAKPGETAKVAAGPPGSAPVVAELRHNLRDIQRRSEERRVG